MPFFEIKISSDRFFKVMFHLVFWAMWIGLPILTAPDDRSRDFSITMLPVAFSNIPLFLFNSEWLIPRVFRKRGLPMYLLSLLLFAAAFVCFQTLLKEQIAPQMCHRSNFFWKVMPVLFITAISTGYGLIVYLLKQEKLRREERQERLQSEVSFLRSQISPHFIFNVLNSIVYLIRSKSEQAEPVTLKLSELMRYLLYESGDVHVLLEKEIAYLENYVELQTIRFGEDVDIRLRVEGSATGQFIEPMLLIPFVENAFKHGVGLIQDPVIDILLSIREHELFFSISNKIAPETEACKDSASGIGLKNVKRRLELLYPEQHRLDIHHADDLFTVQLTIHFCDKHPTP